MSREAGRRSLLLRGQAGAILSLALLTLALCLKSVLWLHWKLGILATFALLLAVPCNYLVETGLALEHQTAHSCMMGMHWFDMLGCLAGQVVLGKAILSPGLNGVLNMVVVLAVLGFVTSFAVSLSAELSTAFCGGDGKAPGIHARAWCLGPYLLAPSFPMHPEAPQDCPPLLCV